MRKLQYNAPVILTFFLVSLAALAAGALSGGRTTALLFCVYRAPLTDPLFFLRLFLHVLGHTNWQHFIGNMLLLLVVGPPMEERYGSRAILLGILVTALLTGLLHLALFNATGLLGASGVVFMLILLSSTAGGQSGRLPLTLVLVALLYLGREAYSALAVQDNISNLTHLAGGVLGGGYGIWLRRQGGQ